MSSQETFERVCRLGAVRIGNRDADVFVKITHENGRLSMSGVEGPLRNGDALGGCGQIGMSLRPEQFVSFADGWDAESVARLLAVWERWHLSDMRAGTPKQEEYLRTRGEAEADPLYREAPHAFAAKMGFASYYDMACKWLEEAGLQPDDGYRYGSRWLREEVPADVLEWLAALPETDKQPAWV